MKLFLVRHGQTTANLDRIYSGQTDVKLTEQGKHEALSIRPILAAFSFDKVYSSDLSRAVDTQLLALPGAVAVQTPLLREYDVGDLIGKPLPSAQPGNGDATHPLGDYTPYGGENAEMVCHRLRRFLSQLEDDPCETAVAFVHNGVMNCMLRLVLNADIDHTAVHSTNCAINVFDYDGKKWRLLAWNYMGKLL